MAAQDVFFSVELNLDNTGNTAREDYKNLIVTLRNELIGSKYFHDNPNSPLAHTWYSHNLPVLRPELPAGPIPWFELVLQSQQNRVTFKLRRDNLYLVGYQVHRPTGNDQWREFKRKDPQGNILPGLIDNSIPLCFKCDYLKMEKCGKVSFGRTSVGQKDLIKAVSGDSNSNGEVIVEGIATTQSDEVRARCLILVIFMISEAVRFRHVSDFVTTNYLGSARIDSIKEREFEDLVKDWGDLSEALLRVDAGFEFYIRGQLHTTRIKNEMDASAALGILKYSSFKPEPKSKPKPKPKPNPKPKPKRDIVGAAAGAVQ